MTESCMQEISSLRTIPSQLSPHMSTFMDNESNGTNCFQHLQTKQSDGLKLFETEHYSCICLISIQRCVLHRQLFYSVPGPPFKNSNN